MTNEATARRLRLGEEEEVLLRTQELFRIRKRKRIKIQNKKLII